MRARASGRSPYQPLYSRKRIRRHGRHEQWRQQHEHAIVDEYVAFLKIPNLSRDTENIRRNADALVEMMKQRGIEARQVSVPGSNPVVFGEIRTAGATRTLGFYAHYDGAAARSQGVDHAALRTGAS